MVLPFRLLEGSGGGVAHLGGYPEGEFLGGGGKLKKFFEGFDSRLF